MSIGKIRKCLRSLYGEARAGEVLPRIQKLIETYRHSPPKGFVPWNREDVFLITYGDSIVEDGEKPLATLNRFLREGLEDKLTFVHLLPFYPYTSDDGFSVVDYRRVREDLGDWEEILTLGKAYRLVFDAVINHVSSESHYMKRQCAGDPEFADFLLTADPNEDHSRVTRPRNLPLLHAFDTAEGQKWFWTTFSRDQIDLNFRNPKVLLEVLDVLLFYADQGAQMIRLDAIPFLWKEKGTTCSHLPQTHAIIKMIRAVFNEVRPEVILLSETNVPHRENISYFGEGGDEAQVIYNFSLPPLILYGLHSGDASKLTEWAASVDPPPEGTTFLNITATHDGIGVRPTEGILSQAERQVLVDKTLAHGGRVSEKKNPDGSTSPYELNITFYSALNNPNADEPRELQVRRFLLSQAIALAFKGIPGIYIHSLFGSLNDEAGVARTGVARSINRQKLPLTRLMRDLKTGADHRGEVWEEYRRLLALRQEQPALHPDAPQKVLDWGSSLFVLLRGDVSGDHLYALHNVTAGEFKWGLKPTREQKPPEESPEEKKPEKWPEEKSVDLAESDSGVLLYKGTYLDVLTGETWDDERLSGEGLVFSPYQVRWLRPLKTQTPR